jgi:hypothetical protein
MSEYGMKNYIGHTNCFNSRRNCTIGCLIRRVQGSNYFLEIDEMKITADSS